MSPPRPDGTPLRRRDVLATAGAGLAAGVAGCGHVGDAEPDRPPLWGESIRVGVLAPEGFEHGESMANTAELASKFINADHGVAGASLDIEVADTDFDPDVARAEHERLCTELDCDLTVGLFLGTAVEETLSSVAEQETVHLTTGSLDGRAGGRVAEDPDALRYHFRPGLPSYGELGRAVGEFAAEYGTELGWERAAVLTENLDELKPFHDALVEHAGDHLEVAFDDRPSWINAPVLDHVEDEGCDVALSGFLLSGTTPVNLWATQERQFDLGGLHLPSTSGEFWADTEGDAASVFSLAALTPGSDNTGRTRDFVDDYALQYDRYPTYSGALTYDALRIYREAVESVVGEDDTELPSQDAIVDALESVTFTDGVVYPTFEFTGPDADHVHEPVWESIADSGVPVVQQWQAGDDGEGRMEAVAPAENRTADFQRADWLE